MADLLKTNELVEKIFDYLQSSDYKNVESIDNKVIKHVCSKTYFQTECNQCNTIENACKSDHVRCLEYLLKRQDEVSLCDISATHGAINCLKFAHKHKYTWNENTCNDAASSGHLKCLEYLHDNGCPWDKKTC